MLETYNILEKEILPRYASGLDISNLDLYFIAVTDRSSDVHDHYLKKFANKEGKSKPKQRNYFFNHTQVLGINDLDIYLKEILT